MARQSSRELIEFIKREEGLRLEPYRDWKTGKTAIGYGDTEGDTTRKITPAEAERRLVDRLKQAEDNVAKRVTRQDLTQGQFDTLVDMEYNIGSTTLDRNGFWQAANSEPLDRVAERIGRYTKARNESTGMYEDVPGLVNRAQKRLSMWGAQAPMTIAGTPPQSVSSESDPFDQIMGDFQAPEVAEESPLDQAMADFQVPSSAPPVPAQEQRAQSLSIATTATLPQDGQVALEARRLTKNGFNPNDALILARSGSGKQAEVERQIPTIAKYFPEMAQWGLAPENTTKIQDEPDVLKKTILSSRPIGRKTTSRIADLAASENINLVRNAYAISALFLGQTSPAEAAQALNVTDNIRRSKDYSGFVKGMAEFSQAAQEVSEPFKKIAGVLGKASIPLGAIPRLAYHYMQVGVDQLKEDLASGKDLLGALYGVAEAMAKNPEEAVLMAASSAVTSAPGLAVGAVNPALGAATAYATNLPIAFAGYVMEQAAERFANSDGSINYEKAFLDPRFMADMKKEASVYSVTMASFEAVGNLLAGANTIKAASKSMGIAKKTGKLIKGFAKDTAVQAVEEGASEVAASTAAASVGGRLDLEEAGKIAVKGVEELALGGIGGTAITATAAGSRAIVNAPRTVTELRQKSANVMDKIRKSREAVNDADAVIETQEAMKESKAAMEDADGMADLIDQSVSEQDTAPQETRSEATADSDADLILSYEKQAEGKVEVSPAEWTTYHEAKGLDPVEALRPFGAEAVESYLVGREFDVNFQVTAGQWTAHTMSDPDVGVIGRFNGNDYNTIEAAALIEEGEKNPISLMDQAPAAENAYDINSLMDQLPPTSEELQADTTLVDSELRPLELFSRGRSEEDKKVVQGLNASIMKSIKGSNVAPEMVPIVAELQYRHLKLRADSTGRSLQDVAKDLRFRQGGDGIDEANGMVLAGRLDTKMNKITKALSFTAIFNKQALNSTVLHEISHAWLFGMSLDYKALSEIEVEAMTPMQAEYWKAMQDVAEVLDMENIGELINLSGPAMTLRQEAFAQTAEKYFLDGDFSNTVIRNTMERLRQFMTSVAEFINRLRGYPTLELSPKVQSIFETLIMANAKIDETVGPLLPELSIPQGFLGDEKQEARLTELLGLARSAPIAEIYGKMFTRKVRERDRLIDEAADRIYAQATEEVMSEPVMVTAEQLRAQYEEGKAEGRETRVSFTSFMNALGIQDEAIAAQVRKSLPNYLIANKKKGGVDIDNFVGALGLGSGIEFIDMMVEMGRMQEKIDLRAKEIADKEFPVFKTDEEIHAIAVQAVNGEAKKRLLNAEIRFMADKSQSGLLNLASRVALPASTRSKLAEPAMNEAANKLVLSTEARDFRPLGFLRSSERLGRQAAQALKSGDINSALNFKYQQGIQFRAYGQAMEFAKQLKKNQALAANIMKYSVQSEADAKKKDASVMAEAQQKIVQLAEGTFDLEPYSIEDFPDSAVTEADIKPINDRMAQLATLLAGKEAGRMDVAGLLVFGDLLARFDHAARKAKTLEIANQEIEIEEAVGSLVSSLMPLKAGQELRKADMIDKYWLSSRNLRSILTQVAGGEKNFNESILSSFVNELADREAERGMRYDQISTKLKEAMRKAVVKDPSILGSIKAVAGRFGGSEYSKPMPSPALGKSFAKTSDFWRAILLFGSRSGAEKLILGGFIDAAGQATGALGNYDLNSGLLDDSKFRQAIQDEIDAGRLNDAHFDLFESVWGIFNELLPEEKKAIRKTDGREMGEVRARSFTVKINGKDRKIEGGYVPVRMHKSNADYVGASLLDPDHAIYKTIDLVEDMYTGFADKRTKRAYPVKLDFEGLLPDIAGVLNVIHMRESLITFGRVFANREVQDALETRSPGIYQSVIQPYFERMKLQQYSSPVAPAWEAVDQAAGFARRNSNMVTYIFGVGTWLKQLVGFLPAAYSAGSVNVANGARILVSQGNDNVMQIAQQYSPRALRRFQEGQRNAIRGYDRLDANYDIIARGQETNENLVYGPIQAFQNIVDKSVFMGVYNANVAQYGPKKAADIAINAVEKSQGSFELSAQSALQFGSNIQRLFMAASNYPITISNLVREDIQASPEAMGKFKAAIGSAIFLVALPSILSMGVDEGLEELFKAMFGEEDKIKRQKTPEELDREFNQTAIRLGGDVIDQMLPLAGRITVGALTKGEFATGPVGTRLADAKQSVDGLSDSWDGVDMTARQIRGILNTASFMSGISAFAGYARYLKYDQQAMTEEQKRVTIRQRRRQKREAKMRKRMNR